MIQVTTELREVSVEELSTFMDEFNHHIFDMVSSPDSNERKGAILAIGKFTTTHSRIQTKILHLIKQNYLTKVSLILILFCRKSNRG